MQKGIQVEFDFINYFNNKTYYEIHPLGQELLDSLFDNIDKNSIIKAYKYGYYAKADMVIEINNVKKGISIKSGIKNSVHVESISNFCKLLKKLDFKSINLLLFYLYSDGTNDNSGTRRISSQEYKIDHYDDIKQINNELKSIKESLINRFLFKTDINYKIEVDAIVSGSVNDFMYATREEILDFLVNNDIDSSGVHISSLFIQSWNKNLKCNPKYEYCRNYIQVKWYSINDDILRIMCKRNNN